MYCNGQLQCICTLVFDVCLHMDVCVCVWLFWLLDNVLLRAKTWWSFNNTDYWEISADSVFVLDFKLSPCSECCVFSFGWFPGVWFIYADVSEHSICSSFIDRCEVPAYEDGTECSETSACINQTPGNHPKENTQVSLLVNLWKENNVFATLGPLM